MANGHGGARFGAGRPKGIPNKSTASLKERFQKHERWIVAQVMKLARDPDSNVRIRAIAIALERGWGKPPQPVTGDDGGPVLKRIEHVIVDKAQELPAKEKDDQPVVH